MRQHLKAIIKQIVVEEMQKEGKGYLRGTALAGLIDQLESIENFQGSDDELFEKLRVLAVRLQRAGLISSTVSEYIDSYRSLKATRSTR